MSFTSTSQSLRPLTVKQDKTEVSILVPADIWVAAEQLREEFPGVASAEELAEIELAARFLKFAVQRNSEEKTQQFLPIVRTFFHDFRDRYLRDNDVHAITRHLSADARQVVINAYYTALVALRHADDSTEYPAPKSALFTAAAKGDAKIFAIFGGQGNIEEYFDELSDIYDTYDGLVSDYVERMAVVLREHASSPDASVFHSKGLDVMRWLQNPESQPDLPYLISAPVSLPLIGLLQLLHYYVVIKVCDVTPADIRKHIVGTTGHSQGIISSVVISASTTEEEFIKNSEKALGLLFWIGTRAQQVFRPTTLNPVILSDSLANNEGNPMPMLAINNLRQDQVLKHLEATNSHLPEDRQIKLTLVNGPRSFVCTGPPQSLYGLNLSLRKLKAATGQEQSRIPYSQRKIKFSSRFLPITAPFHSSYLAGVDELVAKDVEKYGLDFQGLPLAIPIFATDNGEDLRSSDHITAAIVDLICSHPVDWEAAIGIPELTHIIDFGPGGTSGIGGLTHRNKEGTGVQVIIGGALEGNNRELSYKADLFDTNISAVRYSPNWAKDFAPKLVRTACNGKVHVDTRMSRLLGKPPLMVAGMTPSTVNEQFVSAVMNAGYHIELAGGGHYNEKALRDKIDKIMALTRPGEGITLNSLFLNVRQWGFQYPLVQVMRREGLPMEGLCIAAGVPSIDNANEIVANLKEAGIKHIAFKPGSVDTIRQVVAIAAANADMPIIMQWTGGRAGGHHSFEDMHQPILETYAAIRRQPNLVLVAGSGFGGAEDTLPYITGEWAVEFGYPPMPFDGILFASRMMVSKEGLASPQVKQAIVDAPGVDDSQWEKTYQGPAGGVITVRSELGEPIHKIATRGVKLWKELDDTIFNLPKEKRAAALLAKKDYIIRRLNADFQKVWFGKKADGSVVDLQDMTYREVVNRMVELMYVKHERRWIHVSLRNMVGDFVRRIEERFSAAQQVSHLQNYSQLDVPEDFVPDFLEKYPQADVQLLTSEDVFHFLTLAQRRGQKPVPFIPVLDKDFEVWFKKDSLWQAEDVAAVVDQDVQRTCILQGPLAVKHSVRADQPVKEILDEIYESHIESLKAKYYKSEEGSIPTVEYLGGGENGDYVEVSTEADQKVFETPSTETNDFPTVEEWLERIAGPKCNWLRALLMSAFVVQDKKFIDNPLRRIFNPRPGQKVTVDYCSVSEVSKIVVADKRPWSATRKTVDFVPSVEATIQKSRIEVLMYEYRGEEAIPLQLLFEYKPDMPYAPIHEVMEGRNDRIKDFYFKLWFGKDNTDNYLAYSVTNRFDAAAETVDGAEIQEFCQSVGNQAEIYVDRGQKIVSAPMDFAIVVGWKAIIKAIFPKVIDGDLLRLVHLSNGFRRFEGEDLLRQGDVVDTFAHINAIINNDSGKLVEVKGVIVREGRKVMEVTSQFLYRGQFADFEHTFQHTEETPMQVELKDAKDIAVLKSKEWIHWNEEAEYHELAPGSTLIFRLKTYAEYKNKAVFSKVQTTGKVSMKISTKEIVEIADIEYDAGESHGNPVIEYLKRSGQPIEQASYFEDGGYSLMPAEDAFSSVVYAPQSNEPYAKVSGDYNPIHVNPYFADLALLPGTITHGMWTSASGRKFVEIFAADNQPQRVSGYSVSFVGMVLPGDQLETRLSHVGMKNGKKIIKVETVNQMGTKILEGSAEVDQPITAYVFTGQGSQEQGMGMALYDSSPVAKAIWDRADKHFMENYGFSIIEIVRKNPKEKTVYFGGPKGNAIRQSYMAMTYDVVDSDGSVKSLPIFPEIHERTAYYTFRAPNGLLSATQFTQPALTLMEKAAFEDMRAKELVQQDCAFAGHSLGEYSALASIGDVLPIESLVDVVFYRGMTMQTAVQRDEQGRSNYGMIAVNPSRVARTFNDSALRYVVDAIARQSNGLLEIVNYNVENWQYVAAGELTNLDVLANVLNYLKTAKIDLQKLMETMPLEEVKKQLSEIIASCLEKAHEKQEKQEKEGHLKLERGYATIPLPGIDVPFHSSFLLSGVTPFRTYLAKKINPTFVDVAQLAGKYIPNVTAEPFSTSKEYIENAYNLTSSPRLGKVLKNWDDSKLVSAAAQQRLGYTLLVELLAYQFASAVRWIETQDQLFKHFEIERLIEVGPSPTLCGMAKRTLALKYEAYDDALIRRRVNLCYSNDSKEIYYNLDSPVADSPAAPAVPAASAPALAPAPVAAAPAPAPAAGPAAAVSDAPIKAVEVLHVVIAQKLKKPLEEVPLSKAVKDLVGGKSTMQNEILGDLQKEFTNAIPEKAEETPLEELGKALENGFPGTLGKHTSSLVSKVISSKMPGGFSLSAAKGHLNKVHGLGPSRADGALLHGVTMEPASRLANEADAKTWLDTVAQSYAKKAGITLGAAAVSGPSPMGSFAPAAVSGPAAVSDAPVGAVEVLHVVIAQKLKKSLEEVPLSKPVKDLVGGKSTMQNEILGDLQKEFGNNIPEKAEETPLEELGKSLSGSFGGTLGKHTSGLVSKMISAKMPGGFTLSNAKAHLSAAHGLGPGRTDGVLLHGLTMEPPARLGNEGEAKSWLDSTAQSYAKKAGISLGGGGGAAAGGAGAGFAVMNSEEFEELKAKQNALIYQQLNLYARYLNQDLRGGDKKYEAEKQSTLRLQAEIDHWLAEHGDIYAEGIKPTFSALKARRYDSYWNWVRQDALIMFYDIIFGKLAVVDREITAQAIHIMNRANPALMDYMRYHIDTCPENKSETYRLAKELARTLVENCAEVLNSPPVWKDVSFPTAPKTTMTENGDILFEEVHRDGVRKLAHYVKEMQAGGAISEFDNRQKVQQNLGRIYKIIKNEHKMKKTNKLVIRELYSQVIRSMNMSTNLIKEKKRQRRHSSSAHAVLPAKKVASKAPKSETIPFLHLKKKNPADPSGWEYSSKMTGAYLDVLSEIAESGITFQDKCVLLTGAGKDSIGAEILKGLLSGGAQVIVTTSRYSQAVTEYYQSIYQQHGSKGSVLIVVPFNQGSKQDVQALISYIYDKDKKKGLGWDLDYVIPFAAIPEQGREIDNIDSKSELAHRIMLTNLYRLLGEIKTKKQAIGSDTRPAQVILPLSPNHGNFGSDGLYSESKIGLEPLFNRWYSESWSRYLIITGAVIGWTRGTGLMNANNMVAEGMEKLGIRTFSTLEMSFNILGLMHPTLVEYCQNEPIWADLNGGFQYVPNLQEVSNKLRAEMRQTSEIRKAIAADNSLDFKVIYGAEAERKHKPHKVTPRANMKFEFPKLKSYSDLSHLRYLKGMLDLEKVVVITGFGEVGPWGNARTRWEMEAHGEFSLEGCIEMAWIMGYIKHHHGPLKNGNQYAGWVDAKSGEPVEDKDVKAKYEKSILEHTGIRLIEAENFDGYDPNKKGMMQEVIVDHDLEPFECSKEEAEQFKLKHGDSVDAFETDTGSWMVTLKKGAALFIPKALRVDRLVAGQIPTGWDAARYGVPKDICDQVDPVTLYVLVATVEALVVSGITDPYEFYQYVHVSEVGNTIGSGEGGMSALKGMFKDRFLDRPVQKDILQESFINTMPAWINMLLLSASGPIKTPVNACATAAVSVESGVESILDGKAKFVIAGGTEDISEESSYEFANMKATSNSLDEIAHGRSPREASRPATSTRAGFMESEGSGAHLLTTAQMALDMGLPIYGIVALTNTAMDKIGRSVPAPGLGVLTTAREASGKIKTPLLDIKYRARQLKTRRSQIKSWVEAELAVLEEELQEAKEAGEVTVSEEEWLHERNLIIHEEARRQEKEALSTWGNAFYKNDKRISPIRGALAVFGLSIDDIGIASFHGTSTQANDKNESDLLNTQLDHLGRSKGNPILAIMQKYLTGHPKGPAAAWMLTSVLQSLQTGLVPGNRNADNVDVILQKYEHIMFPSRSIQTDGLKAGILKSFGFGQAGGEVLVIHPDYVLGALEEAEYTAYMLKNKTREQKYYRYMHDSLTGVCDFVQVKSDPPYSEDLEKLVYLNPSARASYNAQKKTWLFSNASLKAIEAKPEDIASTKSVLESVASQHAGTKGVGVDVELTSAISTDNHSFVERNFTKAEIEYCNSRPDPQASFAGRWSAKEAVFKALSSFGGVESKGAAAPLSDIEIVAGSTGAPEVVLHGEAKQAAQTTGAKEIKVSISHSGAYSVAVAYAL